jgi:hypothetical protein
MCFTIPLFYLECFTFQQVMVWPFIMGKPSVLKTETMIRTKVLIVPPTTKVRGGIIVVTTLI